MKDKSKVCAVIIGVGLVYAILPDPVPGPIDDLAVNCMTCIIAWLTVAAQKKINDVASKVSHSVVSNGEVRNDTAAPADACRTEAKKPSTGMKKVDSF